VLAKQQQRNRSPEPDQAPRLRTRPVHGPTQAEHLLPGWRFCQTCGQRFEVTAAEVDHLHAIAIRAGWPSVRLPNRCTTCRHESRRVAFQGAALQPGETLERTCTTCHAPFTWPGDDGERVYFQARGWPAPRRCRGCRQGRRP
jgi:5-methylcytosine-specific restriction endonuclease McrA